jgi:adenylate cyclase class 2
MPLETEIKLRVDEHEPIRRRLRSLGAATTGRVLESNEILDRPDGSLREAGCGLRLRWVTSLPDAAPARRGVLTFKGPVLPGAMKRREELEVEIGDAATASTLLKALGFAPILRYDKWRETWRLGECKVELDEPPGIGLFVEIEGPDEQRIRRAQASLDLLAAPQETGSYVSLLRAYCDRQGIADRTLLLSPDDPRAKPGV